MTQPYFTVPELAERWDISESAIGAYGADGLLSFGIYVVGLLHVEIGDYGPAPDYEFVAESAGCWSGFVPVTPKTVAAAWLNGISDSIGISNTDCGKVVRVVSYIPHDERDGGPQLLVAGEEVERFEMGMELRTSHCSQSSSAIVEQKKILIRKILDALQGADSSFDREAMPGTRRDFHELCKSVDSKKFAVVSLSTFNDYLIGICKFKGGRPKATDYYKKAVGKIQVK